MKKAWPWKLLSFLKRTGVVVKRVLVSIVTGSFTFDLIVAALSLPVALLLRLGVQFSTYGWPLMIEEMVQFTLVAGGVCIWTQAHKGIWRYTSVADLIRLARTIILCELLFCGILLLNGHFWTFPSTVFIIQALVLGAFWGGARVVYRICTQIFEAGGQGDAKSVDALLVGTGPEAELFLRELSRQKHPAYRILGIVGSQESQIKRQIHGLEILGHLDQIEGILEDLVRKHLMPDMLILVDPKLGGKKLKYLSQKARELGLDIGQCPSLVPNASPLQKNWIKPLSIMDLLGRPEASLDKPSMLELIKGKRILVTGVGGSIGGELMRQIAEFSPAHIALLDHSEYLLYQAALNLQENHPYLSHRLLLVDVRERERIFQIMAEERPDYVFHAAALKHVPLVENHLLEAVFTNVLGTCHVADACVAYQVKGMLLVSTDKAINPTSLMGLTKRLAESYCQSLDVLPQEEHRTRFITVRFGNVLGSTGSVVPFFQRQIERGGPITVTHPDIKRYFMTIQEAVELVLQATVLGMQPDIARGRVFVLDMGEPVSILDLAENMIQLSGLTPHKDIKITFTGLRPGEKMVEELFHDWEKLDSTVSPSILIASPRLIDCRTLKTAFGYLEKAVYHQEEEKCLALLRELVPEYSPGFQGSEMES